MSASAGHPPPELRRRIPAAPLRPLSAASHLLVQPGQAHSLSFATNFPRMSSFSGLSSFLTSPVPSPVPPPVIFPSPRWSASSTPLPEKQHGCALVVCPPGSCPLRSQFRVTLVAPKLTSHPAHRTPNPCPAPPTLRPIRGQTTEMARVSSPCGERLLPSSLPTCFRKVSGRRQGRFWVASSRSTWMTCLRPVFPTRPQAF